MTQCLIAVGSNLGDRTEHLRRALEQLDRSPLTRVIARSRWHETPPVGGPPGQGAYLNGAVLATTQLGPPALLGELLRIESLGGRVRGTRWEARVVDLDLLLFDDMAWQSVGLSIPHPRMPYRRFVLAPAAEVAPWMIHPESGWTIQALLEQLDHGADEAVVAALDPHLGVWLTAQLTQKLRGVSGGPRIRTWEPATATTAGVSRPKLILAAPGATGSSSHEWRKMLSLPAGGPVAWLPDGDAEETLREATDAMAAAWSERTPIGGTGLRAVGGTP